MTVVRTGALTASLLLLACWTWGSGARAAAAMVPPSGRWRAGVNYKVLSSPQPTHARPGKVQVIEFFYLACPFCYALEPHMLAWRKTMPAYVQFVRVPVTWAPLQVADARLFYTLEALGRDDLVETAFGTIHRLEVAAGGSESVMIGDTPARTLALQEAFAERHGVSGRAFVSAYNAFGVHVELGQARQLWKTYQIQGTPAIIIDGRFKTGPSYFRPRGDVPGRDSGDNRTIELINLLTQWVHYHPQAR
ncbi:MAG: thiol:disulfide interchange protein DsbA/DsbL, partial [Steroidobacteraceae bacterium]